MSGLTPPYLLYIIPLNGYITEFHTTLDAIINLNLNIKSDDTCQL